MSWSVAAIGKPAAVGASIAKQAAGTKCSEPEEGIRQAAIHLLATAVLAQNPAIPVKVAASGSQSVGYDHATGKSTGVFTNSLTISVEPQYGFVE